MKNIIERLNAASLILRDNEQYNDDPDYNPEGLAADACDDAASLIKHLAAALSRAESSLTWFVEDKGESDTEALTEVREALEMVNQ